MGTSEARNRRASTKHPRDLSVIERKQLKQAEAVRKRLDAMFVNAGPDWIPDKDWMDAHLKNGDLIVRLMRGIRLGREADKKIVESMPEEQMDAVFVRELMRLAPTFSDEQWAHLDRARAQQVTFREGAEASKFAEGNQAAVGHR